MSTECPSFCNPRAASTTSRSAPPAMVFSGSSYGVDAINVPIPRSGCRNATRSGCVDMKRETCFPRSLVIVNSVRPGPTGSGRD